MFKPAIFQIMRNKREGFTKKQMMTDFVAGIIVAIIALPLSVALGISSGVSPEEGLITAIVAGFFVSFLGGSKVQIGGPTGAFVVIVYGIIKDHGLKGLIIATLMAGIILIIFGLLRMGTLIKYIPNSVTIGFTAGIAITLFSTQVKDFLGMNVQNIPSEFISKWGVYLNNLTNVNMSTILLGVFSLLVIVFWGKINKVIPGSLIALILSTAIAYFLKLDVGTIGSQFGEISSNIPMPKIPVIDFGTIKSLIGPAFTIAFLAAIESLLSAVVADSMTDGKHDSNTELIGQGIANIASSLFGGIPATGAIARTAANIKNGGKTPIAGMVHAACLLLIMKIFMPLIKYVPLTTLGAILLVVSYNMSQWREFIKILNRSKKEVVLLLTTFILTVAVDLVTAIGIAMVIHLIPIGNKSNNEDLEKVKEEKAA